MVERKCSVPIRYQLPQVTSAGLALIYCKMIHRVGTTYLCLYDHICISKYIRKRPTRVLVLGNSEREVRRLPKSATTVEFMGPTTHLYVHMPIYIHTQVCIFTWVNLFLYIHSSKSNISKFTCIPNSLRKPQVAATYSSHHCNTLHKSLQHASCYIPNSLRKPQVTATYSSNHFTATHSSNHCNALHKSLQHAASSTLYRVASTNPLHEPQVTATYSSNHCTATHSFNHYNVLHKWRCHAASSALHHATSTNLLREPHVTATYSLNHCNALHKSLQHEITTLQHNS